MQRGGAYRKVLVTLETKPLEGISVDLKGPGYYFLGVGVITTLSLTSESVS